MDVNRYNLSNVFTRTNGLEIPFFQRAYVWDESHLERLLEDVENACSNRKPYFIGMLILKQKRTPMGAGDVRLVIDGQQRLTALSILCKVLCLKNSDLKKFDDSFRLQNGSIVLKHNDYDRKVYEQIMSLERLEEIESENNVAKTYKYFCDNLKPEKLDFDHIYTSINFANIDIHDKENEQEIFDTINTLGARLTTVELLKNYFFFRGEEDRANYEKYWKNVFEKDEATRSYWNTSNTRDSRNIDIFFFSYLNIKAREKNISTKSKSIYLSRDSLLDFYKEFIKKCKNEDRSTILSEILDYSELFKNAIDKKKLEKPLPLQGVERINAVIFALHMNMIIPYILFVEKNVKDKEEKSKLYDCLEACTVRQVLFFGSCDMLLLFSRRLISERILSANALCDYLKKQKGKIYMPSDEDIRISFHKSTSLDNHDAKTILYLMESKMQEKKYQSRQLLNISEYSVEHLMPKDWRKEWPLASDPHERDRKLRTLGNLTITTQGLNSLVDNHTWDEKRVELKEHSGDMKTLCGALEKEQWNEDAIDERAEKLADIAIKIWPGI